MGYYRPTTPRRPFSPLRAIVVSLVVLAAVVMALR